MPAIRQDSLLLRLIKDVTDIRANLRRVTVNLPLFDVANENTPTILMADQDNYLIGNYDILRLDSTLAVSITGLRGGIKGRYLRIFNISTFPITLIHQSGSSLAANRFFFSNARDTVIPPSSNVLLYYDVSLPRWVGGDYQSSGVVYGETFNVNAQIFGGAGGSKVDLGAVVSDQYGFIDIANNRIVIPFDGAYVFHYSCLCSVFDGNRSIIFYLNTAQTNHGVSLDYGSIISSDWLTTATYSGMFSAGDIIEVYFHKSAAADLEPDSSLVFFRIS
jgi:hypothetical protein